MVLADVAVVHQRRTVELIDAAASRALAQWRRVDFADLDRSWVEVGPRIVAVAEDAQRRTANAAGSYAAAAEKAQGVDSAGVRVNGEAVVGVDGSGRSVDTLLQGSIVSTKRAVAAGVGANEAMIAGAAYLVSMMKTALADVARSSDVVASAGKGFTDYVRVIQAGACQRCAILAGIRSSKDAFERHPGCRCMAAPTFGERPEGFFATPEEYFDSLSEAEQDRVFTRGGAEAIRSGARVSTVVSARRGATGISYSNRLNSRVGRGPWRRMERVTVGFRPDGSAIQVFTTTEGTTARGVFGRNAATTRVGSDRYSTANRIRLMPESIVELTDDVDLRKVLLRDAGYLDYPIQNYSSNEWVQEHRVIRSNERRIADDFYRSLGVTL